MVFNPPPYRVLVSVPDDYNFMQYPRWLETKEWFIDKLKKDGLEPQIFGSLGDVTGMSGKMDEIIAFMKKCQGAVVLGLPRHSFYGNDHVIRMITEYSHIEGIMALQSKIPLLTLKEFDVAGRGIVDQRGGHFVLQFQADISWLENDKRFNDQYKIWVEKIKKRHHIFFGYSGKAKGTAAMIINFLRVNGIQVLDWATNFGASGTILQKIEDADSKCLGGLFLFTKDDEILSGDSKQAAPRDNVIFEAGYFMNSKGENQVLIIREDEAKMPADLGGHIYLMLKDRNDISSIETQLLKWIQDNL
jgi:hypothetical protein